MTAEIESNTAARIQLLDVDLPGTVTMVGGGVEVRTQGVHSVLESMRIKVDEIVILEANEVERMFGFAAHDTDTTLQGEHILDTAIVDGIEGGMINLERLPQAATADCRWGSRQ